MHCICEGCVVEYKIRIIRYPFSDRNKGKVWGMRSVVGIANGYGLGGPGIEFRWGRDFPNLYRPALGPTQPPV